jgi:hypothetical protein
MKPIKQSEKTLEKLSKNLVRYAEIYATGTKTKTAAAMEAGYSYETASARSSEWIGRTRQDSKYPFLYDYYETLRKENLRAFDITAENVLREISLIGFSDITRFVDLPSKESERKKANAYMIEQAIFAVRDYQQWEEDMRENDNPNKVGPKFKREAPSRPNYEQLETVAKFAALSDEERAEIMVWKDYAPGSIRIKNIEDIPKALLPAIAEISNTREGIKIKLHDKMGALDKLARYLKLYDQEDTEKDKVSRITKVEFVVNGSKSALLDQELGVMKLDPTG